MINNQIDVTSKQFEVVKSIEGFVEENLSHLLKPISESWQPTDLLPDMRAADWREQITEFRRRAKELTDEVLVVLVGDMVTEEALPSYQTWLNRFGGIKRRILEAVGVDAGTTGWLGIGLGRAGMHEVFEHGKGFLR